MRYPIAIEAGDNQHAFGVVVPDLLGCFSAGDSLDEAMAQGREAILLQLEGMFNEGKALPQPSPVDMHAGNPDFKGWIWAIVEIKPEDLSDAVERVNITLPKRVLTAADRYAAARGETRSGFLARAALETMARD